MPIFNIELNSNEVFYLNETYYRKFNMFKPVILDIKFIEVIGVNPTDVSIKFSIYGDTTIIDLWKDRDKFIFQDGIYTLLTSDNPKYQIDISKARPSDQDYQLQITVVPAQDFKLRLGCFRQPFGIETHNEYL